ncbi:MAG: GCN5-related N-acetyltransferase [uncultured bacterium]|nr:MAG: GCN5-related N-acetyltransferase [uncultured bacterium]
MKPILLDLPMPIETPRLLLRPPQLGDGRVVNEAIIESLDELKKFMPWAMQKPSPDETEIFVRQAAANWLLKKNEEPYLPLFIFDKISNQFIGSTGYHHFDWDVPSIEIGYWIRTSQARKGLMTEAVNALTQYAFKQLSVKCITITCDINNIRSKKIPEKLNYRLQSVLQTDRIDVDGKVSDTLVFTKYDLTDLPQLKVKW